VVLEFGHFGEQIRNAWEVLKYGAGEERRRSVGLIVCELRKYDI
jgi:hypothetical protein